MIYLIIFVTKEIKFATCKPPFPLMKNGGLLIENQLNTYLT